MSGKYTAELLAPIVTDPKAAFDKIKDMIEKRPAPSVPHDYGPSWTPEKPTECYEKIDSKSRETRKK